MCIFLSIAQSMAVEDNSRHLHPLSKRVSRFLITGALIIAAGFVTSDLQALSRQEALLILGTEVLKPSDSVDHVVARMLPAPLAGGIVEPTFGGPPTIDVASLGGGPQWFAMVDLEPCALFEHDVIYAFIDDVTGAVVTFDAADWPMVDGVEIGSASGPGSELILVLPLLPRPNPVAPGSPAAEPVGDYGDAPDGQFAYAGVLGEFPTFFATTNSTLARPGAHALTTGRETLGLAVTAEQDVVDPLDPDGATNIRDADSDERMFLSWDPNTTPATSHLIYDVTVAAGAPAITRHVNAVIDFDRNARWQGDAAGVEWSVVNQAISVSPGTTETLISPPFAWGDGVTIPTCVWVRVALTRSTIDAGIFGAAGWDGSGAFDFGEIEDFEFYLRVCPPMPPPVADPPPPPPPCPPAPGNPNPPPPSPQPLPPGPERGWNGQVVGYRALVIQGPDHGGEHIVAEAAATMEALLDAQGYAVERLLGPTSEEIADTIEMLKPDLVCEDRILIYFIAHGSESKAEMLIRRGGAAYKLANLRTALDQIESCTLPALRCDEPERSCDVTVIIESCYSGQWQAGLEKVGRRIITTSAADQPSWGGSDGSGGEYSDRYAECAQDAAADQPPGNGDGFLDPSEIHAWATMEPLNTPRPQTPDHEDDTCECKCPTPVWDSVFADDEGFFFGPGVWTKDGVPIGETFGDGAAPEPGVPLHDHALLPEEPNDWHWFVQFTWRGIPVELDVWVVNLDADKELGIEIICVNDPAIPGPFVLEIDPLNDVYEVSDGLGSPLWEGSWSLFPTDLPPFIETTGSVRRKMIEEVNILDIPTLSPGLLVLLALLIAAAGFRLLKS